MSFISFNLNYYKEKIEYYERTDLTESHICEAKRLLKLIDDLVDEGYYELFNALQENFFGVDRLKAVIKLAGEKPFSIAAGDKNLTFDKGKTELTEYTDNLLSRAKGGTYYSGDSILSEIKRFCNSIEYDENRSYIFLLRDTLLPYLYFKSKYAKNIYPYIISRSFLKLICKDENIDDIVRTVIFQALENGYNDFDSYTRYCKNEILNRLTLYPQIMAAIKGLLLEIKSEKIVVIETGCYGTFPMLLSALDDRIEFKMYTTVPYLLPTYKKNIFTDKYENLRSFETLYCQNNLFQITDFRDGRFYVSENENKDIIAKSLNEISCFLNG